MLTSVRPVAVGWYRRILLRSFSDHGDQRGSAGSLFDNSGDGDVRTVLYVSASPSGASLVSDASEEILAGIEFPHRLIGRRNLWSDSLISFNMSHMAARMRLAKGKGTDDDEKLWRPVQEMAEELRTADVLLIASPMWNFSFPYVLKQV